MNIQAEVSLYPLRTDALAPAVRGFLDALRSRGVTVVPGAMSSQVRGEADAVFAALANAFADVAKNQQAVVVIKASNACPEAESL